MRAEAKQQALMRSASTARLFDGPATYPEVRFFFSECFIRSFATVVRSYNCIHASN
jgi:hypothetical protein